MTIELVSLDEVSKFILSLKLPNDLAKSILKSKRDCELFSERFYKSTRRVTTDLLDFRLYKIEASGITMEIFLTACLTDGVSCSLFEQVFMEEFIEEDIVRINEALLAGKVTLESLFTKFKENPDKRILLYLV